jgi:misacylated tRNA(Ala) deacylase
MSDLLYQTDSYMQEFGTAFFPGGGGQPHDVGWLTAGDMALAVTRVKREGEDVWHFVSPQQQATSEWRLPQVGASVTGRLDWARRYQLMRTHTALHVLCGVVYRDYGALVTGGNMEPLRARMDFEFETLRHELVKEIEDKVNAEVAAGREVRVKILPRAEAFQIPDLIRTKINLLPPAIAEVRTVEIVGLDLQADGGTHVANTLEVGRVHVVDYKSKGRINKRIEIEIV